MLGSAVLPLLNIHDGAGGAVTDDQMVVNPEIPACF